MILKSKKGMTFIEVSVASFVVVFMVLAMISLITRVYGDIFQAKLKTYSFNLASEHLEIMKTYNFGGLKVTPDNLLPEPLSNLEDDANPWGNPADEENIVDFGGMEMKIYKIVQNAEENYDGEIVVLDDDENSKLKKIRVIVAYTSKMGNKFVDKRTELISYASDSASPFGGAVIKGRCMRKDKKNGNIGPPGHAAKVWVYVEDHPEYVARVSTDNSDSDFRGYYSMYNVMPGTYYFYAQGDGYEKSNYVTVTVEVDDTEILGVNFITPQSNLGTISGTIYGPDSLPVNINDYQKNKCIIRCDDGMSFTTTANTAGEYEITNVNDDINPVNISAIFVGLDGTTYLGSITGLNPTGNPTNQNITLALASGTSTIQVWCKDARDKATALSGVNIYAVDAGTNTIPVSGGTGISDGSGYCLLTPPPGIYRIYGNLANYSPENDYIQIDGSGTVNLYFYPVGSVSGNIVVQSTGSPPAVSLGLQAFSRNRLVSSANSDTITGFYQIDNLVVGNYNRVRLYVDGSSYDFYDPKTGVIEPIQISHGTDMGNQDFTVTLSYRPIKGNVSLDSGIIKNGVVVIAQPVSNTLPPHAYRLDHTTTAFQAQTALKRKQYPYYGAIAKRNGNYELSIPVGSNYDVYAYYTYLTNQSKDNALGEIKNFYKKLPGVAPDSDGQNFTGTWTEY